MSAITFSKTVLAIAFVIGLRSTASAEHLKCQEPIAIKALDENPEKYAAVDAVSRGYLAQFHHGLIFSEKSNSMEPYVNAVRPSDWKNNSKLVELLNAVWHERSRWFDKKNTETREFIVFGTFKGRMIREEPIERPNSWVFEIREVCAFKLVLKENNKPGHTWTPPNNQGLVLCCVF